MNAFKDLLENKQKTLVILDLSKKNDYLKQKETMPFFVSVKFLSTTDLIQALSFSYHKTTRLFVSKHLNVNSETADLYLNVLPFYYLNQSLPPFYQALFDELIKNNLLHLSDFKSRYDGYVILLTDSVEPIVLMTLNRLGFEVILPTNPNNQTNDVHLIKALHAKDEVNQVFEQIARKLDFGVNINQIKLIADQTYHSLLEVYSELYQIPVSISKNTSLVQFQLTKDVLNKIAVLSGNNTEVLTQIKDYIVSYSFHQSTKLDELKETILSELNDYLLSSYNYRDCLDELYYHFQKTALKSDILEDVIQVVSINYPFLEDHIVFVLGFNAGAYPTITLDNDFLSDEQKKSLNLLTSIEKTQTNKKQLIHSLSSIKHLTISYKVESPQGEAYPSFILQTLPRKIKTLAPEFSTDRYSIRKDKLSYKALLDTYHLYGIRSPLLESFEREKELQLPKSYDPTFKGFNDPTFINQLTTLSFTKLNDYFLCGYQFYLKHLLNVKTSFEESTQLHLGNFFHEVLKDYQQINNQKDINDYLTAYLFNHQLTLEQQFFLKESIIQLEQVLTFIKTLEARSSYLLYQTELEVSMPFESKQTYLLLGKIDKILRHHEFSEKIYVVDYKTGNAIKPLDYLLDGFNSQLLFYLLFLKKNHFESPYFSGFFYQNIYTNVLKKEEGKTYEELQKEAYQLSGYKLNDLRSITEIDPLFQTENTLAKTGVNKDGSLKKSAWVYEHQMLSTVLDDFEALLLKTIKKIEAHDFDINPKIASSIDSCKNCAYRDICYLNKPKTLLEKNNPFERGDDLDS